VLSLLQLLLVLVVVLVLWQPEAASPPCQSVSLLPSAPQDTRPPSAYHHHSAAAAQLHSAAPAECTEDASLPLPH
jgi:hypothetical protein